MFYDSKVSEIKQHIQNLNVEKVENLKWLNDGNEVYIVSLGVSFKDDMTLTNVWLLLECYSQGEDNVLWV